MAVKSQAEIQDAIEAQVKICKEDKLPHFAPRNGVCWSCKRNIYQNYENSKGVDGTKFITGCPHCNRTYCD